MKIFNFSAKYGKQIDRHGSIGACITPIIHIENGLSVQSIHLEPMGLLGLHPAAAEQLLLVTAGEGFVSTQGQDEVNILPGSSAFWEKGEYHQTRAGKAGMQAIVIEGEGLKAFITLPPT